MEAVRCCQAGREGACSVSQPAGVRTIRCASVGCRPPDAAPAAGALQCACARHASTTPYGHSANRARSSHMARPQRAAGAGTHRPPAAAPAADDAPASADAGAPSRFVRRDSILPPDAVYQVAAPPGALRAGVYAKLGREFWPSFSLARCGDGGAAPFRATRHASITSPVTHNSVPHRGAPVRPRWAHLDSRTPLSQPGEAERAVSNSGPRTSAAMATEYDHLFKLVLVGEAAVGKSSLLLRFTEGACGISGLFWEATPPRLPAPHFARAALPAAPRPTCTPRPAPYLGTADTFDDTMQATIGVDFKVKMIRVPSPAGGSKTVKATIWDTAGARQPAGRVASTPAVAHRTDGTDGCCWRRCRANALQARSGSAH